MEWRNAGSEAVAGIFWITVLVFNEAHLRRLVKDYVSYYHTDRTHDGLEKDTPASRPVAPKPTESARLLSFPRVGGLHHRYDWQQAA